MFSHGVVYYLYSNTHKSVFGNMYSCCNRCYMLGARVPQQHCFVIKRWALFWLAYVSIMSWTMDGASNWTLNICEFIINTSVFVMTTVVSVPGATWKASSSGAVVIPCSCNITWIKRKGYVLWHFCCDKIVRIWIWTGNWISVLLWKKLMYKNEL